MTNIEAFILLLDDDSLESNKVASLFDFYGIDPNDEWKESKDNPINCKFYRLLIERKLNSASNRVSSEREGGYSVSYDNSGVKKQISALAMQSGCSSLIEQYGNVPTIKDISGLLDR